MKTVFDKETRDSLIKRLAQLDETKTRQWGKMNVYQMLKHCTLEDEMWLGKTTYKRTALGFFTGQIVLRVMLRDESPIMKNLPTNDALKVHESDGDINAEKAKWKSLIEEYSQYPQPKFHHWFFGKMTKEQVGYFAFKHADHHLRQFNL